MSTVSSQISRNGCSVAPWVKQQANVLLRLQWSSEQVASKQIVSREKLCTYTVKLTKLAICGRTCVAKSKSKTDSPMGEIAAGKSPSVNCWASYRRALKIASKLVIGNASRWSALTVSKPSSWWWSAIAGMKLWWKYKTQELMRHAIISALRAFKARVKTMTYEKAKSSTVTQAFINYHIAHTTLLALCKLGAWLQREL